MNLLKRLLSLALVLAAIPIVLYVAERYALADRLTGLFFSVQSWLPLTFSFEQFLVALDVACLVMMVLAITASALVIIRLGVAQQKLASQAGAARREVNHIQEHHRRQYGSLVSTGQALAKRLDKRLIIQAVLEAASHAMSAPQANGVVSCWLLKLETNTIRFELGLYCDETMFAQTEFQQTEAPFSRVITSRQAWMSAAPNDTQPFIKPEKRRRFGDAIAMVVVPFVIEGSVLGALVIYCHPDVLKSYSEQRPFYDALWAELTLALAIAIQGEVTILDRLTGAHNRDYFTKRLIQEIERANRFQLPLSLLMVDIDNFKAVNDTLGHPQGDAVLRIIARLIGKSIRAVDLAGRYGGEEFIVMLPETGIGEQQGGVAGAAAVAERIRQAIDDEFHGMQKPLNLTVSIGAAVRRFPEDQGTDYRDLVRVADEQLYQAKTTGKNKVCVFVADKPKIAPDKPH